MFFWVAFVAFGVLMFALGRRAQLTWSLRQKWKREDQQFLDDLRKSASR
jgi:hypothetical protein